MQMSQNDLTLQLFPLSQSFESQTMLEVKPNHRHMLYTFCLLSTEIAGSCP